MPWRQAVGICYPSLWEHLFGYEGMFVLGTAGHVDHGKSTLVKALTGIDPDRLKEEKEREMTIDLGFAWLRLPSGREVSIVDVPGHERFIRNMLAGVGGIDLVMLVVAADEGVMPQTREHLAILDLLQVKSGLVVLTKSDLVDQEWLEMVREDVLHTLQGTVLEGAPIVVVSAVTGEGLDTLKATLDYLLDAIPPRPDLGRPRLPIDRSFAMPGFGTVVTGTLLDGSLTVGMEVELVLLGRRARIRGLHRHRQKVEVIPPGSRAAVNLTGVEHQEVHRGEVLTIPGWLTPTNLVDVHLRCARWAPQPLRHNMGVTFHAGTAEVLGRLRLLDADALEPGQSGWAQVHLSSPLALVRGEPFILRASQHTLGGGTVVDAHPQRHRRHHTSTLERLALLLRGSSEEVLRTILARPFPQDLHSLGRETGWSLDKVASALERLKEQGQVVAFPSPTGQGEWVMGRAEWENLRLRVRATLQAFHSQYPLRRGMPREDLRARLGLEAVPFGAVLSALVQEGEVAETGALVRLANHTPRLSPQQEASVSAFLRALEESPYAPPAPTLDSEVLAFLAEEGKVVKVAEGIVFSARAYQEMVERILAHLRQHGRITVAQMRDMFGTSRKYALALAEYLDQKHITRRVGDERVLAGGV
ncbi:Selenocysteine-specific elongation factor [bacterium HR23]|nr:Selenocysteine-specific elongation factor [bacterium HR23]